VPQSQWDRPVRKEWLFLGGVVVIGARITANLLDPGWTQEVLKTLLPMSGALICGLLVNGGAITARRVAALPVLAIVFGTIFEVERRWGWIAAGPLVVVTFVLVYQSLRSGILAPRRDAPSST